MNGGPLSQEEIDAILRGQGAPNPAEPEGEPDPAGAAAPGEGDPEGSRGNGDGEEVESVWPPPESPLTDEDMDVLAEIANISMGSAATAVSALVHRKVTITTPTVSVSTPREVWEQFELPTVTVEVRYVSGLKGRSLFILRPRDAAVIADLMMGNDGRNPPEELDELRLSAVSEAMNQMMGSSATAMSDFFNLKVDITAPEAQLTEAGDRSPLASSEPMAAVSFRLGIEDLIDSNFVQLMPFPFAINLVNMARRAVAGLPVEEITDEPTESPGPALEAGVAAGAAGAPEPAAAPSVAPSAAAGPAGEIHAGAAETAAAAAAPTAPPKPGPTSEQPVQKAVFAPLAGAEEQPPAPPPPLHNVSLDLIRHIPVEISASLGETEMSLQDLLRLTTGALVQLNTEEGDLVRIFANGVEIARGEVVVVGEYYGVRITDIVGPAQRLNSLNS